MSEKNIHWFPGHMKKALNEIEKKVKLVDLVVEVADSRAPISSRNPMIQPIIQNKRTLLVLSKADIADISKCKKALNNANSPQNSIIFADFNNIRDVDLVEKSILNIGSEVMEKSAKKGIRRTSIRVMIIGIPNVGKSTLINRLCRHKKARVENKPGLTRAEQWIKISDKFELLDTPGILPSSYDNKFVATKLALLGSIRESILPNYELCNSAYKFLTEFYNDKFKEKYALEKDMEIDEFLSFFARKRGFYINNDLDIDRAEREFLSDFKNGKICAICLD